MWARIMVQNATVPAPINSLRGGATCWEMLRFRRADVRMRSNQTNRVARKKAGAFCVQKFVGMDTSRQAGGCLALVRWLPPNAARLQVKSAGHMGNGTRNFRTQ